MAKSKKRKKKNPSKAQWAVLGVGGVVGVTLLGLGGYYYWKGRKALPGGGGLGVGAGAGTYDYQITALTSQQRAARAALGAMGQDSRGARPYDTSVYSGGVEVQFFNTNTRQAGSDRARAWIAEQGGMAVCTKGCPQGIPSGVALPA